MGGSSLGTLQCVHQADSDCPAVGKRHLCNAAFALPSYQPPHPTCSPMARRISGVTSGEGASSITCTQGVCAGGDKCMPPGKACWQGEGRMLPAAGPGWPGLAILQCTAAPDQLPPGTPAFWLRRWMEHSRSGK